MVNHIDFLFFDVTDFLTYYAFDLMIVIDSVFIFKIHKSNAL